MSEATTIAQTTEWIRSVVIGCNFCPFAAKAMSEKRIRNRVLFDANVESAMEALIMEMKLLDDEDGIETTLIILPDRFHDFRKYLDLVSKAETTVTKQQKQGVYQIASFHPDYCFAGVGHDDPANYTNRSIFPMLHILREESITRAMGHHPDAKGITDHNIAYARQKGLLYMQMLRAACMAV